MNPMGLASRVNPSQLVEASLGKIAEKLGKPYLLRDFDTSRDLREHVLGELAANGLKSSETVTDVRTGRKIPNVFTGNGWIMKLHHSAEDKLQGRGLGGYLRYQSRQGGRDAPRYPVA